jgi:iron complex transport system substrate-binding protein
MQTSADKTEFPLIPSHEGSKRFSGLFFIQLIVCLLLPVSFAFADNTIPFLKVKGTTVKDPPPSRILSLDLCTDWMLAKYANPSQVLALSPLVHQYPVNWLENSWPTHDGSLEQILELKPDLVITGEYNALLLRQRLQELGIKVAILKLPKNLGQMTEYEKHFLSLIGASSTLVKQPVLSQAVSQTNRHSHNRQPRLLLLGANGIGTGQQTFENDIIKHAGWANYLHANGYINLDLEQIVSDPPDAILWSAPASTALSNLFAQHPVLKQVVPKNRWLTTEHWKWRCPGPWTWDLVNELHDLLPQK